MRVATIIYITTILAISIFLYFKSDDKGSLLYKKNYPEGNSVKENIESIPPQEYPYFDYHSTILLNQAENNQYSFEDYDIGFYKYKEGMLENSSVIKDIVEDRIFFTVEGLCKFMQLNKRYDIEYDILKQISKRSDILEHFSEYIYYIESSYIRNVPRLVNQGLILKARALVGLAYERLYLVDTPPLYFVEFGDRVIIDKILLYNMIFNDPRLVYSSDNAILKDYVNLIESEFKSYQNYEKYYKKVFFRRYPIDITNYFYGLQKFYDKDYKNSYDIFTENSLSSPNMPLSHLSQLLCARVLYWSLKESNLSSWKDKDDVILTLKEMENERFNRNYISDISFYRDSIFADTTIKSNY